MAVGDTTNNSIIWVPGEPSGRGISGASRALPTDQALFSASKASVVATTDPSTITASGVAVEVNAVVSALKFAGVMSTS